MAIATTQRVLYDGVRNAVVQITGVSDGSGNENHVVKVSMAGLNPRPKSVLISKLTSDVNGTVKLTWDGAGPVDFAVLSSKQLYDYSAIGGMTNGADTPTGDITLTTQGFGLNSSYTILLHLKKKYVR